MSVHDIYVGMRAGTLTGIAIYIIWEIISFAFRNTEFGEKIHMTAMMRAKTIVAILKLGCVLAILRAY